MRACSPDGWKSLRHTENGQPSNSSQPNGSSSVSTGGGEATDASSASVRSPSGRRSSEASTRSAPSWRARRHQLRGCWRAAPSATSSFPRGRSIWNCRGGEHSNASLPGSGSNFDSRRLVGRRPQESPRSRVQSRRLGETGSAVGEVDRRLLPRGRCRGELTEEQIAAGAGPDPAPARAFPSALPVSPRAGLRATIVAVRDRPPPSFPTGSQAWRPMHRASKKGEVDMSGS